MSYKIKFVDNIPPDYINYVAKLNLANICIEPVFAKQFSLSSYMILYEHSIWTITPNPQRTYIKLTNLLLLLLLFTIESVCLCSQFSKHLYILMTQSSLGKPLASTFITLLTSH